MSTKVKTNKVRINQGRVMPWQFRFLGSVMILSFIFYAMSNFGEMTAIFCCIGLSMLVPVLWSNYYILEIDPEQMKISEITLIAGFQKRSTKPLDEISHIFVNAVAYEQSMASLSNRVHTRKLKQFKAFLKTTSGDKFFLLSAADPEIMENKLAPIRKKLNCEVINNNALE
ncbi:MAG: hypothetical protein ACJA2C_001419 [Marinoscillum sp.]|jgi:hypothetical protein